MPEWEGRWQEIAPGSELLAAVWAAHGGAFDETRDGVMIAEEMAASPQELRLPLEEMSSAIA